MSYSSDAINNWLLVYNLKNILTELELNSVNITEIEEETLISSDAINNWLLVYMEKNRKYNNFQLMR